MPSGDCPPRNAKSHARQSFNAFTGRQVAGAANPRQVEADVPSNTGLETNPLYGCREGQKKTAIQLLASFRQRMRSPTTMLVASTTNEGANVDWPAHSTIAGEESRGP